MGSRPVAVWDKDIREKNLRFLKNFDSRQFEYQADVHLERIGTKDAQQSAIAIRTTYGLALETLLSLLGATLQAPGCIFGWLSKYKERHLGHIIRGIEGNEKIDVRFKGDLTWQTVSETIHRNLIIADKVLEKEIKTKFAIFWKYLAEEYLNYTLREEFNCAKHGLRIQPGGFRIGLGIQKEINVPVPLERLQWTNRHEFGSTVFTLEEIVEDSLDHRIIEKSHNWDIASLVSRIRLISKSINNIVTFLLIVNGEDPGRQRFFWPEDMKDFERVGESDCEITSISLNSPIKASDIAQTRDIDVKKSYSDE